MKTLHEWNIAARRAALKQRQKDVMADFKQKTKERQDAIKTVSYTHLTLPTIYSV